MPSSGRSIGVPVVLNVLSTGLVFLANVVLARLLDVAGYGIYAYVVALVNLLTAAVVLGFDRLLTRDVAALRHAGRWELLRGLVMRANTLVFGLALIVAFVLGGLGHALTGLQLSEESVALWVGLAALPFAALSRLRQAALVGLQQVIAGLVPETLVRPALLLLAPLLLAVLLRNDFTAAIAVGAFAFATIAAFVVGSILFARRRPRELVARQAEFATRQWLRTGLEFGIVGAIGLLVGQVDLLLLGALAGAEAAGLYAVAWRGAALIAFGLLAVNAPVSAAAARLWVAGEHDALQRVVTRSSRVVIAIALPVAGLLIFAGDVFLGIFGQGFVAAGSVLAILTVGQLVNAAVGPVGALLIMTGYHRVAAKGMAIGVAITVTSAFLLIPSLGPNGAALAATLGTITWNLILGRSVLVKLGLHTTPLGVLRLRGGR